MNKSWSSTSETPNSNGKRSGFPLSITPEKRRKISTKNCQECLICSDEVFEVCHPHLSAIEMLKKKGADGVTTHPIWCQICQTKHIDPKLDQERRQRIVLGSSTLAHLWKSNGFNSQSHIDFDCIIGGQIHDVHLSFIRQYMDVSSPLDIVLACGMNNVPTTDTPDDVILQFESFLMSIRNHSERYQHTNPNRVVICPLLFAPKFCDAKLSQNENHLSKILCINKWIKDFNENTTGLHLELDKCGVKNVPKSSDETVEHLYDDWNEPQWNRMLHLSSESKSKVAQQLIQVFTNLDSL